VKKYQEVLRRFGIDSVKYDVEIPFKLPSLDAIPVSMDGLSTRSFDIVSPIKGTIEFDAEQNLYTFVPNPDTPPELIEQHKQLLEDLWNNDKSDTD
jgi:hypothetical protein